MSINWQEILFHFLGGLGYSYSIKTMGDGLQQLLEIAFVFTLTNIPATLLRCAGW